MRKQLFFYWLCLGLMNCLFAETELNIQTGAFWTKESPSVFRANYPGRGWAGMYWKCEVEPHSYYQISCEAKSSSKEGAVLGISVALENIREHASATFQIGSEWTPCVFYFYSRDSRSAICRPHIIGQKKVELRLQNLRIRPVTLLDFKKNLIPDSDFEKSGALPNFWRKIWNAKKDYATIVPNEAFPAGRKNLKVSFVPASVEPSGIRSHMLPVLPGRTYRWSFWAKTEQNYRVTCAIHLWPQFGTLTGKHIYQIRKFVLSPEWREYSLEFTVPMENSSDLPPDRTVFLQITGEPSSEGVVLLDQTNFYEID